MNLGYFLRGVEISLWSLPTDARLTFCANFIFEIFFITLQGMSLRLCEIGFSGFLNKPSRTRDHFKQEISIEKKKRVV